MKKAMYLFLCVLLLAGSLTASAQETRPLMRYPDIHDNTVVFVYGGDIWSAPVNGGVAQRLTINDGQEVFPRFSPDGSLIAFTGQYDGNADVYVMNRNGGDITRLTFHPGYDRVIGWDRTKNKIMFISGRSHFRFTKLYLISPDGTGLEEVILHNVANASFSPDGKMIAYNRISRENRTWKRYRGGTAQEIYLYDLTSNTEKDLTSFRGTDRFPMWIGDKIFFTSDRDRRLNIYSVDPAGGAITQLTHHSDYDVRFPSTDGRRIVYELCGSLHVYDTGTGSDSNINVTIKTDAPEVRPTWIDVGREVQEFSVGPDGRRALIVARGEVFSVPKENGPTRNLSQNCGARDREAVWSPDGTKVAFISDASGEYQIYLTDPKGGSDPVRLTNFTKGYPKNLRWSPDSKKLAWSDETLTLYYMDVATKKIVKVDKADYEHIDIDMEEKPIYDHTWSPDSRYIAYSKMEADLVTKVFIYSLAEKKSRCISGELYNDFHPAFSRDGRYLFFVSNRRFSPTLGDFEWEMVYKKTSGIYALRLQKDTPPFLPLKSDEVMTQDKKDLGPAGDIDFDGIQERVQALPLPRGNYRRLAAGPASLYYLNADEGDFNRFKFRDLGPRNLCAYSFDSRQGETVIENVTAYDLSADGSSIAYRRGSKIGIIAAAARKSPGADLNLGELKIYLDPRKEWSQIFWEAWRLERDFYYTPAMHGLDWKAVGRKYGSLLPYACCRQDLGYLIGEMIGELNTSHTYVFGGDTRRNAKQVNIGMLGADYKVDTKNNLYQFARILTAPDWSRSVWPPLADKNVKEGNHLLAVNGEKVTADRNIYSYFENLAGTQVTLTINDKPTAEGAHVIKVQPLSGENTLRYRDWVEINRKIVEKASGGKIGYLHFPDTYLGSATEFPAYFFSQARKEGLIIDGRFNGGGLDPVIFLERLNQKPHSYWTRRYSHDQTSPFYGIRAHMACLTNRQAGSGGDEFPFEFQQFGMGPVIGTRTWGGLVGVSMFMQLIDGGGLTAPDYRIYMEDGRWVVENEGVTPDIEIDLQPAEMARGYDAQLHKAIDVLIKQIKEDPITWPKHPPVADDSK